MTNANSRTSLTDLVASSTELAGVATSELELVRGGVGESRAVGTYDTKAGVCKPDDDITVIVIV